MASDRLDNQVGHVECEPDGEVEWNVPEMTTQIEVAVLLDTRSFGNDYISLRRWWRRWRRRRWVRMVGMVVVECFVVVVFVVWVMIDDDFRKDVDTVIAGFFMRGSVME